MINITATVIPNVVGVMTNLSEEQVLDKCFDLVFAFDEVTYKTKIHRIHFVYVMFVSLRIR